MNTTDHQSQAFDTHARDLHQAALGALDPATLARLRAARQGATAAAPRHGRHRALWMATACSAVLALGLGVHFNLSSPVPSAPGAVSQQVASVDADEVLDQNPDLYVWLGSQNALAMEYSR
ncbi:hypothetical protein P6166_13475 [Stenotrophomonas sp. HITSZ_GD]|uniref:hypothetical protein n=1 Tax=Stenotrophomonas sp. HITSZ_GD TaxID=3037248 RepID=UPI00240D726B|nr:hypothetical protein [Stenotrophomonas sp. HITSZ_GD]MDG2526366.1 hypothetical protein [Stenotrophomonas sp. HITSZ_GD]